MKTRDAIVAPPRGSIGQAKAFARSGGAHRIEECMRYLETVWSLCTQPGMPDPSEVVGQSLQETSDPGPWQSYWWTERLNPAGLGITGDPQQNAASPTFRTGEEAARAQVSHLLLYATGTIDRGGLTPADDPRYDAYVDAYGNRAVATTIAGLAGTWATDPNYAVAICRRGNDCFAGLPNQEETGVAYETDIPGMPGGPLVTSYPILIDLIPAGHTYQRPGDKAGLPRRGVQHGTGNPSNDDAAAEARYFVNGAEGRQASIHYCTDDTKAVVVVPVDEVTWQAADGSGPGNLRGLSCEMMEASAIWGNAERRDKLIALTADLMGRSAARLDIAQPEQHWTFNYANPPGQRHNCPEKLRTTRIGTELAWDVYAALWWAARKDEVARMAGGTDTARPPLPSPWPRKRIKAPDLISAQHYPLALNAPTRFVCVHGTTLRTGPSRDAPAATKTPAQKGRTYTFGYRTTVEEEVWLVSAAGSWALAKAFEPED
jgi:hypothetical protein